MKKPEPPPEPQAQKEKQMGCSDDKKDFDPTAEAAPAEPPSKPYVEGLRKRLINPEYALEYLKAAQADGVLTGALRDVAAIYHATQPNREMLRTASQEMLDAFYAHRNTPCVFGEMASVHARDRLTASAERLKVVLASPALGVLPSAEELAKKMYELAPEKDFYGKMLKWEEADSARMGVTLFAKLALAALGQ